MRAFTVFFALVVGLTWALTVVADPKPVRIRNPFRRAGPNSLDTANDVHVRSEKKDLNVADLTETFPQPETHIQQRRRSFIKKAKAKDLSVEKVSVGE
ncbi:hypothetical protein Ocin01_11218 [Orchesella cincta]|uniref:Uncharacterized protein n=1 Tax=Orchesella cincta TaxID=48709 RepID=A0A1D2MQW3_ORCCI|nr:hypothetical protein Ocin01_11218 [Orchesella cincta]